MRKDIRTFGYCLVACAALAFPATALAQHATEGAVSGAGVGAAAGFAVGGPVGAAVGAGVGGTVGAAAGDTNRREPHEHVIVEPSHGPAVSEKSCVTDSYGNRTCTEVHR